MHPSKDRDPLHLPGHLICRNCFWYCICMFLLLDLSSEIQVQVCPLLTLKRESLIFCSRCLWTIAQMTRNLDVCNNSLPLRYGSSLSAEWLDVRAKRCATTNHELMSHKKTAIRPHNNVPQTSIFHLIPHTPPRCGAKRTDAQRQEKRER